jgi:hypothetical protein
MGAAGTFAAPRCKVMEGAFQVLKGAFQVLQGAFQVLKGAFQVLQGAFQGMEAPGETIPGTFPTWKGP